MMPKRRKAKNIPKRKKRTDAVGTENGFYRCLSPAFFIFRNEPERDFSDSENRAATRKCDHKGLGYPNEYALQSGWTEMPCSPSSENEKTREIGKII